MHRLAIYDDGENKDKNTFEGDVKDESSVLNDGRM
mgnify:CR=1 FL=1